MSESETGEMTLEDKVQYLFDRQQILDCVIRYARGLDRHDEEVLASVFHEDAIDWHDDFIGHPADFVPWANTMHEANWNAHTHMMSNNRVEIDGDVAHSETYVLFTLRRKDNTGIDWGGGRYIDRLERRAGEWKIARRQCLVEWYGQAEGVNQSSMTYPAGTWDHTDPSYRRPFDIELPAADELCTRCGQSLLRHSLHR